MLAIVLLAQFCKIGLYVFLKIPSRKLKFCPKKDQKGHKIPNQVSDFLSIQFNFKKLGLDQIGPNNKNEFQDVCLRTTLPIYDFGQQKNYPLPIYCSRPSGYS